MLLVVDDDPRFLEQAQRSLAPGPRGILFAGNADQARVLMRSLGTEFSAVIIDLDLPGQEGFSPIREVHQQFPNLPVIAISGALHKGALESAKCLGATEALQKPISPEWHAVIDRARGSRKG